MHNMRSLKSWQVYQESTAVLWSKSRLTGEQAQHWLPWMKSRKAQGVLPAAQDGTWLV